MAMRWLVLSVRSPTAELESELAEGLLDLGGSAVEEMGGGVLRTWLPEPASPNAFASDAADLLAQRARTAVEVSWEWHDDQDWLAEWRRGLGARRVGRRIVVTPTWIDPDRRAGDIVIALDPQMAFGTGEHATTRLVLAELEALVRGGERVLDMGTGSGILAIAAAGLGAGSVDAVEYDAEALPNALENIERNGAPGVRLLHAEVNGAWLARSGPYDVIVANVLSGVLVPLLPDFRAALAAGGRLVLSGILRGEADGVVAAARAAGLELAGAAAEDEWWCGVLHQMA